VVEVAAVGLGVLGQAPRRRRVRGVCRRGRGGARGRIGGSFVGSGSRVLGLLGRWSRIHRRLLEGGRGEYARWR